MKSDLTTADSAFSESTQHATLEKVDGTTTAAKMENTMNAEHVDSADKKSTNDRVAEPVIKFVLGSSIEDPEKGAKHLTTLKKDLILATNVSANGSSPTNTPKSVQSFRSESKYRSFQLVDNPLLKVPMKPSSFEKVQMLGKGDCGKVFLTKIKGQEDSPTFAMKMVNKKDIIERNKVQRVLTEKEFLTRSNHPFIVKLHASFQTKQHLYFVMDYCQGGELFKFIRSQPNRRLKESDALFYAAEVLLALEYVHYMGYVYRDLKPENVLISRSGHIVLSDFDLSNEQDTGGVAIAQSPKSKDFELTNLFVRNAELTGPPMPVEEGDKAAKQGSRWSMARLCGCISPRSTIDDFPSMDTESHLTKKKMKSFVGTIEYIAPEIIEGKCYSGTVDWWTFGVFLYELVVGHTPFKGTDQMNTFERIMDKEVSFPKDVTLSSEVKNCVCLLLAKDIEHRLQTPYAIKLHPFFKQVNWGLVRNMQPPFIPQLDDKLDASNFFKFDEPIPVDSDDEDGIVADANKAAAAQDAAAVPPMSASPITILTTPVAATPTSRTRRESKKPSLSLSIAQADKTSTNPFAGFEYVALQVQG